jgi:exosortase H (IPTLxxWG-CTERM-specific)
MSGRSRPPRPDPPGPKEARPPGIPLRFIILFVLFILAGNFSLAIPFVDARLIEPWTQANASAAAGLTRLFGMDTDATGMLLTAGAARLSVKKGCNGVEAVIILASAILAFPAPWSRRLLGLLLGAAAVFGFNILRLVNLLVVAVHFPERLELFHIFIWQTLIILIAFGLFILWGTRFARKS